MTHFGPILFELHEARFRFDYNTIFHFGEDFVTLLSISCFARVGRRVDAEIRIHEDYTLHCHIKIDFFRGEVIWSRIIHRTKKYIF